MTLKSAGSQLRHSTVAPKKFRCSGRTKPIVSNDYIVGLTDGEGCFYALVRPPFNRNGGGLVQLNFFIKVKEQDKKVLEKIRNTLKCGYVYFQHERRKNHTQCYRYTVSSHKDILNRIIPFFQKHPLQSKSKQKSFGIFCRIAEMVRKGKHHKRNGIQIIRKLKNAMNYRTRVVRETRSLRGNSK